MMKKNIVLALALYALTAGAVFAQQYNSEKDFAVMKEGNTITITQYIGRAAVVNIPPKIQNLPVTSIAGIINDYDGSGGFITSVTIPNSVTSIGVSAFSDCSKLTSITIPNSVTVIGAFAFVRCKSLTSVTIPNSVTKIEEGAFFDCSKLTSITIPNSVTGIENAAFVRCASLTSLTIPDSVTSIGERAFEDCTRLTSITFQGTIASANLHASAFYGIGDLRAKFYATDKVKGTPGTYTRPSNSNVWTKARDTGTAGSNISLNGTTWGWNFAENDLNVFTFTSPTNFARITGEWVGEGKYTISGNKVTFTFNGQTKSFTGTISGNELTIEGDTYKFYKAK